MNYKQKGYAMRAARKRSDYAHKITPNNVVVPTVATPTIETTFSKLFGGKTFEVTYEVLGAGTSTEIFTNPKKEMMLYVQEGEVYLDMYEQLEDRLDRAVSRVFTTGQSVPLLAGKIYKLEFRALTKVVAVEQKGYQKTRVVLDATTKVVAPLLVAPAPRERRSRAREQIAAMEASRPDKPLTPGKSLDQVKRHVDALDMTPADLGEFDI